MAGDNPLRGEKLFKISELQERLADISTVAPATIVQWIKKGIKTKDGRVRLEGFKLGGQWKSSEQAVKRFLAATNREGDGV